jgi:hypothetical protein
VSAMADSTSTGSKTAQQMIDDEYAALLKKQQ